MGIVLDAWEQTKYNLAQDFLDLFLPPKSDFSIEPNYPKTASTEALIEDHYDQIEMPEFNLLLLDELSGENDPGEFSSRVRDWIALFAYHILEGFSNESASKIRGDAFEGLRKLANIWGSYLACELERFFHRYEIFAASGEFLANSAVALFRQIPTREVGYMVREWTTPAYIRAAESMRYQFALFENNKSKLNESLAILKASDIELERQIADCLRGYSTMQLGREMQRMIKEAMSQLRDIFSNDEFKELFPKVWPVAMCKLSWYLGHRLQCNLQYDPSRTIRLLESIDRHKEIAAAMEQYRYTHGWEGNRNKAVQLGWKAVAPKYSNLSEKVGNIKNDEEQEKLIGVMQGLKDYTDKNMAIEAINDGLTGKLGAYLRKSAENEEKDYHRKGRTDGNRILTEAKHAEELHPSDEEEELSDEAILDRQKEKYYPSGNRTLEEVEYRENCKVWLGSLTEQEKTAVKLKSEDYSKVEIAKRMNISHQRVSQLLQQARKKWQK